MRHFVLPWAALLAVMLLCAAALPRPRVATAAAVRGGRLSDAVWLGPPVGYSALCWYIMLNPDTAREVLPTFCRPETAPSSAPSLAALVPRSIPAAYELGRAVERGDSKEASRLLQIEIKDLSRVAEAMTQLATRGSPLQTLLGVLSFVNVLGAAALVGVAVALWPATKVLLGPILEYLAPLGLVVKDIASLLSDPAFFAVAVYFVAESTRADGRKWGTNAQIAALGALGVAPAAFVWSLRRGLPFGFEEGSVKVLHFFALWCVTHLAPVAVLSQSRLVGFATVAALYAALGFFVAPLLWDLGWAIGFTSKSASLRCEIASAMLLAGYAFARDLLPQRAVEPFRAAVAVFGSLALGLAELIASSVFNTKAYYRRNAVSLGLFLVTMAAGHLIHSPGVANTSLVFFVLWFTEKVMEHAPAGGGAFWPALLAVSGGLWGASLWLREHDDFLPSLFALE